MAISLRAATGLTAGTSTAITWTMITGEQANDLLIACYGGKPYNATFSTPPSGYTARSGGANGTTANGVGAGSVYAIAYTKVAASASEANPTGTLNTAPSPSMVAMLGLQSTNAGNGWTIESTNGSDATATGTTFSATGAATLAYTAGDWVVVLLVHNDDSSSDSAFGITVPGCTVGTVTQRLTGTLTTATGNDGRMYVVTAEITGGTATGAPTITATTGSGDADGQAVFLRVEEPPAASVDAVVATASGDALAPSITADSQLSAATATASADALAPTIAQSSTATAVVATAVAGSTPPLLNVGISVTIATATAAAAGATAATASTQTAVTATADAAAKPVSVNATLPVAVTTATAAALPTTLATSVQATTAAATADAVAPHVALSVDSEASAHGAIATASVTAYAPVIASFMKVPTATATGTAFAHAAIESDTIVSAHGAVAAATANALPAFVGISTSVTAVTATAAASANTAGLAQAVYAVRAAASGAASGASTYSVVAMYATKATGIATAHTGAISQRIVAPASTAQAATGSVTLNAFLRVSTAAAHAAALGRVIAWRFTQAQYALVTAGQGDRHGSQDADDLHGRLEVGSDTSAKLSASGQASLTTSVS